MAKMEVFLVELKFLQKIFQLGAFKILTKI